MGLNCRCRLGNSYPRCNCYHEDADDFEDDEDYGTIDSDVSSMFIFLHFVGYSVNLDAVFHFQCYLVWKKGLIMSDSPV